MTVLKQTLNMLLKLLERQNPPELHYIYSCSCVLPTAGGSVTPTTSRRQGNRTVIATSLTLKERHFEHKLDVKANKLNFQRFNL